MIIFDAHRICPFSIEWWEDFVGYEAMVFNVDDEVIWMNEYLGFVEAMEAVVRQVKAYESYFDFSKTVW